MASVTVTKYCYFYKNNNFVKLETYTETLTPGLKYTPSKHLPTYDSSVYTEYEIFYGDVSYTTGSLTCPDKDFALYYNFYSGARKTVTLTRYCEFRQNGQFIENSEKLFTGLVPGEDIDPDDYLPSYDTSIYCHYTVYYNDEDVTGSLITVPSKNFRLEFIIDDVKPTVTCNQEFEFWQNNQKVSFSRRKIHDLVVGEYFRPSDYLPEYDKTIYTNYKITYNNKDYTTGRFRIPANRFFVYYRFDDSLVPDQPTEWECTAITSNSVIVKVTNPGTADDGTPFQYFSFGIMNSSWQYVQGPTAFSQKTKQGFGGLKSNTTYYAVARWSKNGIDRYAEESSEFVTKPVLIKSWDWSKSNGTFTNGDSNMTVRAYDAITSKGFVSDFSYKVWNDMVEKVLGVWHAQNGYFDESVLTYDKTLMTSEDKNMTAVRFNSLRQNIDKGLRSQSLSSTGLSDMISMKSEVKGNYFVTLTNSINRWIKTL